MPKNVAEQKVFNSLKVNRGFPEGMSIADFVPGAIVQVQWEDIEDERVLITEVEPHAHNFKGDREFIGLNIDTGRPQDHMQHTQIVRLVAQSGWTFDQIRSALHKKTR